MAKGNTLGALIALTLRDPRAATRWLMTLGLDRSSSWQALIVVAIFGVLVNHIGTLISIDLDAVPRDEFEALILMNANLIVANPFLHMMIYTTILVMTVFCTYFVSAMMRGTGGFGAGILVIAWIGFVWAFLSALQLIVFLVSPSLAGYLMLGISALMMWVTTNSIAELHGFQSLFTVFIMMCLTFFAAMFGFVILLALIGISAPGGSV